MLDVAEGVAGLAREHQIERFGSRDQDVRRAAGDLAAVLLGRVAGARCDADPRFWLAEARRGEGDPGERGAQVALDVVSQGLERADVQDADVAGLLAGGRRARVADEAVERVQERGKGLATPRGRVDQRVLAAGDRRPTLGLGFGRRLETGREPIAHCRAERRKRIRTGERGHGTCQYRSGPPIRPDVLQRANAASLLWLASTPPRVNNRPVNEVRDALPGGRRFRPIGRQASVTATPASMLLL